jgi:RNA 2',3'-cyclic 3'-phosphodiesterase
MQVKKKRIFIAVNLPGLIKENIKQKCLALCLRAFPFNKNVLIKWTALENLHSTLKFLGSLSLEEITKVEEVLEENTGLLKPFVLEIKNFGLFPERGNPRILWLEVFSRHKILEKLAFSLEKSLVKKGFRKDSHIRFISHITLGRVKKRLRQAEQEKLLKIKKELQNKTIEKFKVESIDIMESELLPEGSKYSLIKKIRLKD